MCLNLIRKVYEKRIFKNKLLSFPQFMIVFGKDLAPILWVAKTSLGLIPPSFLISAAKIRAIVKTHKKNS